MARYRDPSHVERSRTFQRKVDADAFLTAQEGRKLRSELVDPALGRRTFEAWAGEWFETTTHLRPSSRARVESALHEHLLPRFGPRTLASLTPVDVRSFVSELSAAGAAPASVRKVYNVLRPILTAAEDAGFIARTPCRGVRLPSPNRTEPRFLTPEELARLADVHPERYRALVLLGGYGGLRFSELAGVRLGRVDFLRSRLTVTESIVEVAGTLHYGDTKSGRGRVVTLPRSVTEALAVHVAAFPPGDDGLLFTAPLGGPLRRTAFRSRVWIPATRRADVQGLRVHDLRHTAAALAIAVGAHPKAIQERLGHASITTTLNVYGHLFPALDEELATRLDELARAVEDASAAGPPRDRASGRGER